MAAPLDDPGTHSRLARSLWVPILRGIVRAIFWILGPLEVRGAYRVPKTGPVLILANHISDLDPVLAQYACPRLVYFLAKRELFDMPGVGLATRLHHVIPVNRGEADRQALRLAMKRLRESEPVVIFPEGQLSEDGELQEIKRGFSLVLRETEAPILCLGIQGANRVLPYGSLWLRPAFRRIVLTWGEPRSFSKETPWEELESWVQSELRNLSGAREV